MSSPRLSFSKPCLTRNPVGWNIITISDQPPIFETKHGRHKHPAGQRRRLNRYAFLKSHFSYEIFSIGLDRVSTEEDELIQQALAGKSHAYGLLVERYQDRLYSAMLHIVGSHDEAEDVVQDSFVQAYIKLNTFQGNSRFFTWLYRIAFNNALSRRRRRRADLSIEQSRESSGGEPEDRQEAPDEPMMRNERVAMVKAAMDKLTDEHRSILVLREMQEMAYEDIAAILEINIGTVRSRLSRARNQLHDILKEMMGE